MVYSMLPMWFEACKQSLEQASEEFPEPLMSEMRMREANHVQVNSDNLKKVTAHLNR